MLLLEEALERLLSHATRLSNERLPLVEAGGRVLAVDVVANQPLPGFDHSAMDGYAVLCADLSGNPPWVIPVVGESSAGRPAPVLAPVSACRIFTGAPLPPNADAVVMQEHVKRDHADSIVVEARPRPGQNVRRAGEDVARGAVGVAAGTRLTAGAIALSAMLDRAELVVARRPTVTILCTGDELRPPGADARPASIAESNSAPLSVLARQAGARVIVAPIVPDEPGAIEQAVRDALDASDVVITVGGVSVGDHDVVRPALERAGVKLDFWKVAIKPGKPLAVGTRGKVIVLCLPGNPASAIVTFALFGAPVLRALQGDARPRAMTVPVRFGATRKCAPERLELVRAKLEREGGSLVARPHDNQSSGSATSLASSDGVALVPAGDGVIAAGTIVEFIRWSDV